MTKIELSAILYSKKNLDLGYRLHKVCLKMCMNMVTCLNFVELTIKTMQLKPQIVLFDLTTIEFNSSQLRMIMDNKEYSNVKLVFIGTDEHRKMIENLELKKIDFVYEKDIESYLLQSTNILEFNALLCVQEEQDNLSLKTYIAKMLFSLGFSPKHTGYSYLKDIIRQVVLNGGVVSSLISDQYPFIAVKYKTTPCNIERNIRNAITLAFKSKSNNVWGEAFCDCMFLEENKCPTNREFICMCVDKILSNFQRSQYA